MKTKPMIMAHGNLILPLTVGQKARYCQNGIWKTTGRVRQIIEQTEDYVKFETDSVRYCIDQYFFGLAERKNGIRYEDELEECGIPSKTWKQAGQMELQV